MPPTSCLVSEKTLAELFLKHYKSVDNTTFGGATAEAVHAMNRKFLADVWTITSRLTASETCVASTGSVPGEANLFASARVFSGAQEEVD